MSSYQLPNLDSSKRYAVRIYVRLKTDPVEFGAIDYDADDDGLIEITSTDQIAVMLYDSNGDGTPTINGMDKYYTAFPNAADGMGCPDTGCIGYELTGNLAFDSDESWEYVAYNAVFEGNDYTLSGLYIDRPGSTRVGLFGAIKSNADIRNLTLSSVNVTGGNATGGLVGHNGGGTVSNVTVSGTVTGDESTGGLVGFNYNGTVTDSSADGTVTGYIQVGGLVGHSQGSITSSSFDGAVTGHISVGGLVGYGDDAGITQSSSEGTVTGKTYVGGLVGAGDGDVANSSSSSTVTGQT